MISNISIHPKTMFKNALNIQDFSFKSHTSTAIIGTNGAGKSTLINTILGIREDYNFKAQNNKYSIPRQCYTTTQAIGSCL
ncbi:ATP-binding cassette domain-containing protein [Helicobacter pylori]|nr:ATP-binding cassette domain-containing protein [Helicobacter pylori]